MRGFINRKEANSRSVSSSTESRRVTALNAFDQLVGGVRVVGQWHGFEPLLVFSGSDCTCLNKRTTNHLQNENEAFAVFWANG
jgi:hypothetical protein